MRRFRKTVSEISQSVKNTADYSWKTAVTVITPGLNTAVTAGTGTAREVIPREFFALEDRRRELKSDTVYGLLFFSAD